MNLFYTPGISGEHYSLSEDESKHCIRVLRLGQGDTIELIDGTGGFYTAEIIEPDAKSCTVKIINKNLEHGKRNFYLHLAVAPTKNNDRFEWFLEKATEIGIDEITPIHCKHSERNRVNTERLSKVLISAMKQSLKAFLPKLNEMQRFADLITIDFQGQKFIAHCRGGQREHLKKIYQPKSNCLILIGPEGDFSEEEVALALQHGFIEIHLGTSRLRTETAAIAACHAVNLLSE